MPPKTFKPPRPSTSSISKSKSTGARKSTGATPKPLSATKSKAKDKIQPKKRAGSGIHAPRQSGLPSLSPSSDSDHDPFASPNSSPARSADDAIEIDSQGSSPEHRETHVDEEVERLEGIPPDLLTRLLHENFKEEGTRLSKDASSAVGKYMETFVREALARAAFARMEAEEKRGVVEGFLEVEDLEVLAPQLLLDF